MRKVIKLEYDFIKISRLLTPINNNSFQENLLEILANWRKNLELRDNLDQDEQEVIMNLSPAYLKQREDWKQEGSLQERYSLINVLLQARFGSLDQELSSLVEKIMELPLEERTQLLLNLSSLSKESLLERFRN